MRQLRQLRQIASICVENDFRQADLNRSRAVVLDGDEPPPQRFGTPEDGPGGSVRERCTFKFFFLQLCDVVIL